MPLRIQCILETSVLFRSALRANELAVAVHLSILVEKELGIPTRIMKALLRVLYTLSQHTRCGYCSSCTTWVAPLSFLARNGLTYHHQYHRLTPHRSALSSGPLLIESSS